MPVKKKSSRKGHKLPKNVKINSKRRTQKKRGRKASKSQRGGARDVKEGECFDNTSIILEGEEWKQFLNPINDAYTEYINAYSRYSNASSNSKFYENKLSKDNKQTMTEYKQIMERSEQTMRTSQTKMDEAIKKIIENLDKIIGKYQGEMGCKRAVREDKLESCYTRVPDHRVNKEHIIRAAFYRFLKKFWDTEESLYKENKEKNEYTLEEFIEWALRTYPKIPAKSAAGSAINSFFDFLKLLNLKCFYEEKVKEKEQSVASKVVKKVTTTLGLREE